MKTLKDKLIKFSTGILSVYAAISNHVPAVSFLVSFANGFGVKFHSIYHSQQYR